MPDGGVRGGGGRGAPGGARDDGDPEATRPNEALSDEPPDGESWDAEGEDWDGESWDAADEAEWEQRQEFARRKRLRRIRRQRIVFLLVVLLVLAVGAGAAMVVTGRWQLDLDPGKVAAPAKPSCSVPVQPVAAPADVRVRVLNSTDRRGLAGNVAEELRRRGFLVTNVANSGGEPVVESAHIVFPPAAAPAAHALAVRVPGALLREDPAAADVALVLGQGYEQLAPEEALLPAPAPPLPEGCPPAPAP
ncbi:LytR C-terminal domain-containing protein [Kineococcus xinjiangensis]|uniref:LytR C-terminal domain-containing protein n=1 Tax=Kineococcus xinjiangensis TaxID=512762 RepID=UPI0011B04844|nr:LytR C-terminal domain-containing protein [Kineococcus xinjiangensis]